MKSVRVEAQNGCYDVLVGASFSELGRAAARLFPRSRAFIIADRMSPYIGELTAALEGCGIRAEQLTVPEGEDAKTLQVYGDVCERLIEKRVTRSDFIVALGGGSTGDLAGFAAATILRGIPYVMVPTTLLSMVDSSIGGKVAVNLQGAKNQVGSFYQPTLVACITDTLRSLPRRQIASGMGEVIKYGAAFDPSLFERIFADCVVGDDVILSCIDIKRRVVERDTFDRGERALLNFGHTVGHALEVSSNGLMHGEAVMIGMCAAAGFGEQTGLTAPGTSARLAEAAALYGLPTVAENVSREVFRSALRADKKIVNNEINMVILQEIGKTYLCGVDLNQLLDYCGSLPYGYHG